MSFNNLGEITKVLIYIIILIVVVMLIIFLLWIFGLFDINKTKITPIITASKVPNPKWINKSHGEITKDSAIFSEHHVVKQNVNTELRGTAKLFWDQFSTSSNNKI